MLMHISMVTSVGIRLDDTSLLLRQLDMAPITHPHRLDNPQIWQR